MLVWTLIFRTYSREKYELYLELFHVIKAQLRRPWSRPLSVGIAPTHSDLIRHEMCSINNRQPAEAIPLVWIPINRLRIVSSSCIRRHFDFRLCNSKKKTTKPMKPFLNATLGVSNCRTLKKTWYPETTLGRIDDAGHVFCSWNMFLKESVAIGNLVFLFDFDLCFSRT